MNTLKVLSAGAVKRGVARIAAAFEKDAGTKVSIEFSPVPEIRKRLAAGETADVVVATPAVMDELAALKKIDSASRGFVGRSRMGLVIHADAPMPEITDTESFNRLLKGLYLAVIFMFLLLVAQFKSLIEPLNMVFSLSLTLTGILGGLYLAGQTFSTVSILAVVILAGMMMTVAVLMIDLILRLRELGMAR